MNKCNICGNDMILKTGKYGEFWSCKSFPKCKNTMQVLKEEVIEIDFLDSFDNLETCKHCGKKLAVDTNTGIVLVNDYWMYHGLCDGLCNAYPEESESKMWNRLARKHGIRQI